MGEHEIKNTPLVATGVFKEEFGLLSVFIKDESSNPFGSIKDRRNAYIIREATKLKVDKLVLITSGNNGYSLACFAKGSDTKVVSIIKNMMMKTSIFKII